MGKRPPLQRLHSMCSRSQEVRGKLALHYRRKAVVVFVPVEGHRAGERTKHSLQLLWAETINVLHLIPHLWLGPEAKCRRRAGIHARLEFSGSPIGGNFGLCIGTFTGIRNDCVDFLRPNT